MKMDEHKSRNSLKPHLHLKISLKILKIMGTWLPDEPGFFRIMYYIYSFLYFILTLGVYITVEFINVIIHYDDVGEIASGGPLFITNSLHAFKVLTVFRNHRKIKNLLSVIESPIFSKDNLRYEHIVSAYAWQGIFHHGAYQILAIFTVLLWVCTPVKSLINGNEKKLPLVGWYPYDAYDNLAFLFTWAHQAIGMIMCCVNNTAIDFFITGLINVASCQHEILKWNLVTIGSNMEEQSQASNLKGIKKEFNDKEINQELYKCIKHNLSIFEFVKEIENIFSTVIGLQLAVNCFVICLATFNISQMSTFVPTEVIANSGYTVTMIYQIFIYCWQGNELYLQNETLGGAIYMGNWWKFSTNCRRNLHIIMLRTQKPLILTTKFLISLTVPTFMSIIQMSYSMFTLLHRKNKA